MKKIIPGIVLILLFSGIAIADTIIFKTGKRLEGKIIQKNDNCVTIKIPYQGKVLSIENNKIDRIEEDKSGITSAEARDPSGVTASCFSNGLALAAAGKFEEAEKKFREELNDINGNLRILSDFKKGIISKEYATYLFEGALYLTKSEHRQAIAALEKAWEINPKDADINYNLGVAHFYLEDYQKARIYLLAALKLQPGDAQSYELLGRIYYALGEYQKAKESLLIAKELFQKSDDQNRVAGIDEFLQLMQSNVK